MWYTCPGRPKASVACRSRCLFGGRWPSWVRLMTSYQNHVHDRLRMLYRWFRSYTSLFQAFHISMTLWCFLSMDAAITRITVWHKNYNCFDTVVSYYITLWTRLLRRVFTILVVLSDYPRLLCAKISPPSLPHSMKKFGLEYLQNQTIDKNSHYLPLPPRRRTNARGPKYPLQPGQVAQDQNLGVLLALFSPDLHCGGHLQSPTWRGEVTSETLQVWSYHTWQLQYL